MRNFFLIGGVISFLIGIALIFSFRDNYLIYTKGELVPVVLTSVPTGHFGKYSYIEFNYMGKHSSIQVGRASAEKMYAVGDTLQVRHYYKIPEKFLLKDDNPLGGSFTALILMFILSVWSFYYVYKKK